MTSPVALPCDDSVALQGQVALLQQQLAQAQARLAALEAERASAHAAATTTERSHDDALDLRMRAQQQMAVLFAHSPTPIALSRLSDGLFVDVNARWMALTGYTLQDVLGRSA